MMDIMSKIDFGNEAADDVDPSDLNKYFIVQRLFEKFLDKNNVNVQRGKSVILQ
jgi:hypothetical protein